MKAKDLVILGVAAGAVWLLLSKFGGTSKKAETPEYWVTQGNTGFAPEAKTGAGVWV